MPHQRRLVGAMNQHYRTSMSGYIENGQFVASKLGLIGDAPGSGKTLSTIAYLGLLHGQKKQQQQQLIGELNPQSNRFFSSHIIPVHQDLSAVNVVVVPPHLLNQWRKEIRTHTTLEPFVIDSRRILRNRSTPDLLLNSHFILLSSRLYKDVYEYCVNNYISWNHIFIDDAAGIYLGPHDPVPAFRFMWLITSQWLNFLFKDTFIYSHALHNIRDRLTLHSDCANWLDHMVEQRVQIYTRIESSQYFKQIIPWVHISRASIILRNRVIQPYAPIQQTIIECMPNFTLANLPAKYLGPHFHGLSHENIPKLLAALQVQNHTIEAIKQYHPSRAELIDSKLETECSICLEPPQNKVLLPCCMNMSCGACIMRQLITHAQCPSCRSPIYLPSLLPIADASDSMPVVSTTKHDACMKYILQKSTSNSYIIYTLYENTYYQLYPELVKSGIICDRLDSNLAKMHKAIENFNNGNTKVLFVSNIDLIRGISLTRATHILFFYELQIYERFQLLLHSALRVGRQEPLTLVHLKASLD